MKMMHYSVSDTGILRKRKSERNLQELFASSDALPLSYRRLVGAKAIKLGSHDRTNIMHTSWI